MKLLTYICKECGKEIAGVVSSDEKRVYSFASLGFEYKSMNDFIQHAGKDELAKIAEAAAKADRDAAGGKDNIGKSFDEITLTAPIPVPIQDVICLGINYADHAVESAR